MNADRNKRIMASNIKRQMDRLGITNQQLCDELNFKYTTFMDWIKAVTYPRIDKIEAMAQYFKCEKSDLIEEKSKNQLYLTQTNTGAVIRQIRKERGMTQQELGETAGMSRSYLAGVETGRYDPSLKTLCRIADAMGFYITVNLGKEKFECPE